MIPSMSRPANPYDNASCESFIKTLKREEIYANSYENLEHLRANIETFIEKYYNQQRLHSALTYRTPEGLNDKSRAKVRQHIRGRQQSLSSPAWLNLLQGYWGSGLKRRPLPQTPSPLKKDLETKA